MQRKLAVISLIFMSILLGLVYVNYIMEFGIAEILSNIALIFFLLLDAMKGIGAVKFRDVLNLKRIRLTFKRKNSVIEFLIALEYTLIYGNEDVEAKIYETFASAVGNTMLAILFTAIWVIIFYRFFFLNMFNEEIIDYDSRVKGIFRKEKND
jgi:hypothetical protein